MVTYRVVRSMFYTKAQFAIARRYRDLSEAVANMADGVVLGDDEHVAAFHKKHIRAVMHFLH